MKDLSQYILENSTPNNFGSLKKGDIIYVGVGTKDNVDVRELTVKSANVKSNRSGLYYVNLMFEQPISERIDKTRIKIVATKNIDVVKKNTDGTLTVLALSKESLENYFDKH